MEQLKLLRIKMPVCQRFRELLWVATEELEANELAPLAQEKAFAESEAPEDFLLLLPSPHWALWASTTSWPSQLDSALGSEP